MHLLAVLAAITISTLPATPLVQQTRGGQTLNFDLILENQGAQKVVIDEIEATVLAPNGALVTQQRLMRNGASIRTLPQREIEPGKKLVIFNPFHELDGDLVLDAIRYDITFEDEQRASITVRPRRYETKADLILPLGGRVFVHDGNDFYSHHRRLDVTGDMTTALGIHANMTRYAYDFTVVDEKGAMHRGDGEKNEDWYGFGQPILAPADGVVVHSAGDRPDGTKSKRAPLDYEAVMKDLSLIFGNYLVIDHGNGEFSMLAHLRQHTVTAKAGDRVKRGQKIGEMGFSGDAIFPHLHYQLQSDARYGEGLPSSFRDFKRFNGKAFVRVSHGSVDTGDVIESTR